eukprot:2089634-Amphidinium_carterae.3
MPSERVTEEDFNIVLELPYDITEEQYKLSWANEEWIKGAFKDYPAIKVEVSQALATEGGTGNSSWVRFGLAKGVALCCAIHQDGRVSCADGSDSPKVPVRVYQSGLLAAVVGIIRAELLVGHSKIEGSTKTKRACGRTLESITGRNTSRAALPLVFNLRKSPLSLEVALELDAFSGSISKHKPGFLSATVTHLQLTSFL